MEWDFTSVVNSLENSLHSSTVLQETTPCHHTTDDDQVLLCCPGRQDAEPERRLQESSSQCDAPSTDTRDVSQSNIEQAPINTDSEILYECASLLDDTTPNKDKTPNSQPHSAKQSSFVSEKSVHSSSQQEPLRISTTESTQGLSSVYIYQPIHDFHPQENSPSPPSIEAETDGVVEMEQKLDDSSEVGQNYVVHHVDYRTIAEARKAELENLRQKSLAKPIGKSMSSIRWNPGDTSNQLCCKTAEKLKSAEAPDVASDFQTKQRELMVEQRQNQRNAMEYLHQYRGDQDLTMIQSPRKSTSQHVVRKHILPPDVVSPEYQFFVPSNLSEYEKSPADALIDADQQHCSLIAIRDPFLSQSVSNKLEAMAIEASKVSLPESPTPVTTIVHSPADGLPSIPMGGMKACSETPQAKSQKIQEESNSEIEYPSAETMFDTCRIKCDELSSMVRDASLIPLPDNPTVDTAVEPKVISDQKAPVAFEPSELTLPLSDVMSINTEPPEKDVPCTNTVETNGLEESQPETKSNQSVGKDESSHSTETSPHASSSPPLDSANTNQSVGEGAIMEGVRAARLPRRQDPSTATHRKKGKKNESNFFFSFSSVFAQRHLYSR